MISHRHESLKPTPTAFSKIDSTDNVTKLCFVLGLVAFKVCKILLGTFLSRGCWPEEKCYPFTFLGCSADLNSPSSNQNCPLLSLEAIRTANCLTRCNFSVLAAIMIISLRKGFILPPWHSYPTCRAKSIGKVKVCQVGHSEFVRRKWKVKG